MTKSEREYVYIDSGCLDARDLKFKGIPERVEICQICAGNGKRQQRFLEGRLTGTCDFCAGTGFIYKGTSCSVPLSVTNQIAVASGLKFWYSPVVGLNWKRNVRTSHR